ncbi:hypothetical protein OHB53_44855 [Streptomyces sp. NBC_00056]|nr:MULTISPECIES: hypothetical protein [unclassified Streptomyces]MCX5443256.1 hypothetical protein [Streptomyces sp. NBC_00063]WSE12376.1 hypothetical protein OG518_03075 [Streptomyces sp. NBC_01397]WSE19253.1 hypothetical protein OG518_41375 [Streptomyces sp. NBC_01397]WUB98666.1 hypothetical protein OHO83_43710 [Streptomyces sp. NBC_00569]
MKPPKHPIAVQAAVRRGRHDRGRRPSVFPADHGDLDGKEVEVVLRSMRPELIKPLTVLRAGAPVRGVTGTRSA